MDGEGSGAAGLLGQYGIKHLRDELLLGLGQECDGIDLLLQPRHWAALAGAVACASGGLAHHQLIQREREQAGHVGRGRIFFRFQVVIIELQDPPGTRIPNSYVGTKTAT